MATIKLQDRIFNSSDELQIPSYIKTYNIDLIFEGCTFHGNFDLQCFNTINFINCKITHSSVKFVVGQKFTFSNTYFIVSEICCNTNIPSHKDNNSIFAYFTDCRVVFSTIDLQNVGFMGCYITDSYISTIYQSINSVFNNLKGLFIHNDIITYTHNSYIIGSHNIVQDFTVFKWLKYLPNYSINNTDELESNVTKIIETFK